MKSTNKRIALNNRWAAGVAMAATAAVVSCSEQKTALNADFRNRAEPSAITAALKDIQ